MFQARRRTTKILGITIGCLWLAMTCGILSYRMWQINDFAMGHCYDYAWWLLFGEHAVAAAGIGLMSVTPLILATLAVGMRWVGIEEVRHASRVRAR